MNADVDAVLKPGWLADGIVVDDVDAGMPCAWLEVFPDDSSPPEPGTVVGLTRGDHGDISYLRSRNEASGDERFFFNRGVLLESADFGYEGGRVVAVGAGIARWVLYVGALEAPPSADAMRAAFFAMQAKQVLQSDDRPAPPSTVTERLVVGGRVAHRHFGEGIVLNISGEGRRQNALVRFNGERYPRQIAARHLAVAGEPLPARHGDDEDGQ